MENLQIIQEKENNLFNRKEVQIKISSKITPTKSEVEDSIAKKFSVSKENIKIKQILGRFGSNDFTINANIYKTKEDKDKTEFKSKKEKEAEAKKVEQEKKEVEKAKEEEVKKESKQEESKPEEKSVEDTKTQEVKN